MDDNQKKFNLYVFLSTFARNLIEVFIPIILFKFGYSLKEVILYYLFVNIFSLMLIYPCSIISKIFDNRVLSFVGILSFLIMQIMLNNINYSYIYILFLSFLYALYRRAYWMARRFYNLKVIHKENIASNYSIISIVNQLGVILSSYIGALLLDFINIKALTILSIIIFVISIVPLYLLKFNHEKINSELNPIKTLKQIPLQDIYLFGSHELLNVLNVLFPLYLYIYVKSNYQVVGILNLVANVATIIFTYSYGKSLDKDKNLLKQSILMIVLVYIFKANFTSSILIVISFLEGIFSKMYEVSISKEFYRLSKKFEYENYNFAYEIIQNSFRGIVTLIIYLFITDLRVMIYIPLLFIIISIFINFKITNMKNFKIKID